MNPEILARIKLWLKGRPKNPYHIEINPTNKCNLNCIACHARGKAEYNQDEKKMTFETYKKILAESAKIGVKEIHLSGGGEPLMYEKIFELMNEIKKNGIRGSIVTNGSLFNKQEIAKLVKIKWDNILYSLDGPDAETHDSLRKKGVFDKVIESIKQFEHYKKKYKSEKPVIELCLVLSKYNYNKILAYLDLASPLKIKKLFIQPIRVNDNELGHQLILDKKQKKEFQDSINHISKKSKMLGIETNLDELDELLIKKSCEIKEVIENYSKEKKDIMDSLPCYSPWYFIGIRPNGDVYPCGVDSPKPFGNVINNNLEKIWYGANFKSFRKMLLSKNIPPFCAECCGMSVLITKDIQKNINNKTEE